MAAGLPVFIWMMKAYLDAVPSEIEEAARVDGASRIGAMVRIVLPLVLPGLVATAVFVAIGAWNEYLIALMMTTAMQLPTFVNGTLKVRFLRSPTMQKTFNRCCSAAA